MPANKFGGLIIVVLRSNLDRRATIGYGEFDTARRLALSGTFATFFRRSYT